MAETRFTKDHEYIRIDGDIGTIGVTDYAQKQLGDIVYVELPETGLKVSKGAQIAVVESVKAASEVYAPISGEIIETNPALESSPAQVNADPAGEGWFVRMKIARSDETEDLMSEGAYAAFVASLD